MMQKPILHMLIAVPAGVAVTLGVLLVMTILVARLPIDIPERPARPPLGFLPTIPEPPVIPTDPVIQRIPPPIVPPGKASDETTSETTPVAIRVAALRPRPSPTPMLGVPGDSPLVAMLRVEPAYPPDAAARGLEGHVVVEFTVQADGTTTDIVVVESSNRIFERAAIRAAERFRYRAKTANGQAQAVHGVRNRFRFRMDQDLH